MEENKPKKKVIRSFEIRQKISQAMKGKKKKYISWLKGCVGPLHPAYKHGNGKRRVPFEEELIYSAWVQGIYQSWNFCCALTGTKNGELQAHHLNAWDSFPEERYNILNGVLLSKPVHVLFHKIYGNGQNIRIQFEHFVETHYKNVDCEWNRRFQNTKNKKENHQPNLCLETLVENQKTYKEKTFESFQNLVNERNHEYVSGTYENIHSEVCIYCSKHDCFHSTTFHNYKRSKTGLPCCGRKRQIDASCSYLRDSKTGRFRDFISKNCEEL